MKMLTGILLFCATSFLSADDFTVFAIPVTDNVLQIDGRLDERCWKTAIEAGKFTRVLASTKELPCQTTVKVLYGRNALYIGVIAQTTKGFKAAIMDNPWRGERVEITLKPDIEGVAFFLFTVSATGKIRKEGCFGNPDYSDPLSFRCQWDSPVHMGDSFWSTEIRIPYESLNVENIPTKGTRWKCNFCRGNGNSSEIYSALNPKFTGFNYAGCNLIFK